MARSIHTTRRSRSSPPRNIGGERCLVADGSVLADDFDLWTPPLLEELDQRFVRNLDAGEGNFLEKLREQLRGGSPSCQRLMAELLWILMLFQSNIRPDKKRETIAEIWSWSGTPLPDNVLMLGASRSGAPRSRPSEDLPGTKLPIW